MTSPRIRVAGPEDATLLARLGAELFAQTFAASNRAKDLQAYLEAAFGHDVQLAELLDPRRRTWIAEDESGTAIGYAQLFVGHTPPPAEAGILPRPSELVRIYTDAGWHGRGIGAALLRAAIDAARAATSSHVWLGVWKKNPRGIAFYEKHGFSITGAKVFRLGNDVQEDWVMVRPLVGRKRRGPSVKAAHRT
ncbi:MAG TPA: GNAT family N-acetyltransferase [Gemmatimonadaceae bacterium]|nr:GNAT family N-acetyltransferase [Gemmatimonadaceae bacterium]